MSFDGLGHRIPVLGADLFGQTPFERSAVAGWQYERLIDGQVLQDRIGEEVKVSAISRRLIEGNDAVGHERVIPSDGWPRSRLCLVENLQESALRHGHFAGEVQLRKARIAVRNAIRAWY